MRIEVDKQENGKTVLTFLSAGKKPVGRFAYIESEDDGLDTVEKFDLYDVIESIHAAGKEGRPVITYSKEKK